MMAMIDTGPAQNAHPGLVDAVILHPVGSKLEM